MDDTKNRTVIQTIFAALLGISLLPLAGCSKSPSRAELTTVYEFEKKQRDEAWQSLHQVVHTVCLFSGMGVREIEDAESKVRSVDDLEKYIETIPKGRREIVRNRWAEIKDAYADSIAAARQGVNKATERMMKAKEELDAVR